MVNLNTLMMQSEIYDLLNELFLSTEIYGFIGPTILVLAGLYLTKKDGFLGLIMIILLSLFASGYFDLISTDAAYWWHSLIVILGVVVCMFQLASKR